MEKREGHAADTPWNSTSRDQDAIATDPLKGANIRVAPWGSDRPNATSDLSDHLGARSGAVTGSVAFHEYYRAAA